MAAITQVRILVTANLSLFFPFNLIIIKLSIVGVLCGECRDESEGVSALLNECVTCSDTSGLLILALS